MTTHSVLAALPMGAIAGVLLLLGSRIRAGDLHLIAGYDPNRVTDKPRLGRLFGGVVTGLGVAALAAGIIQATWPRLGYSAALGFGGAGLVALVVLLVSHGRYEVTSPRPPASGSGAPLPPNDR